MQRRQKSRKGHPPMIMNSSEICNVRNIAMPAIFHKACCMKRVYVGGRTSWVVKVSGECD